VVFHNTHDDLLRQAIKSGKSAEDAADLGQISANIKVVSDAIKEATAAKTPQLAKEDIPPAPAPAGTISPSQATSAMIQRVKESTGKAPDGDALERIKQKEMEVRRQ